MATNDFLSIAGGASANVLAQVDFASLTTFLENGFQSGIVESDQFNKVIRQSSFISAVIGQLVANSGIDAEDDGDEAGFLADLIAALQTFSPPPGSIIYVAKDSAPTGFLKANGAEISRETYADLFSAIGTTFGVGDGSTTFEIPDLRGEFLRGWDDSRGIDLSRVFGSWQKGTLVAIDTPTQALWGISADVDGDSSLAVVGADDYDTSDYSGASLSSLDGEAAHSIQGDDEGWSGTSRPRNIALLACIKY